MRRKRDERPVRRLRAGVVGVDLAPWVLDVVAAAAESVRCATSKPGTPAFDRLYSRVDEGAEVDDPLVVLTRQTMLDEVAATVAGSARKRQLTDAEAEAWVQVLGLALSMRAAELGVRSDADRDAVGPEDDAFFGVVHTLQVLLIEALDGPAQG